MKLQRNEALSYQLPGNLDNQIGTKEMLTEKNWQSASKMVKKLEVLSTEFKTYHCSILDQIEEQQKLPKEEVILDKHEDKVEEQIERVEELVVTTKPVIPQAPGKGDHRLVATSRSITEAYG